MSLTLTVHRGTHQIGGTCIEIQHASARGSSLTPDGNSMPLTERTMPYRRLSTAIVQQRS